MNEENIYKNIVRVGKVSSVDIKNNTARVNFADKGNLVSGHLKIMQNQPTITIEKEVDGEKWDVDAVYATADRKLGFNEKYKESTPDIITLKQKIRYEKKKAIPQETGECTYTGIIDEKTHKHIVKVYPWLPYIGQTVLCIYLPNGEGDGFIIGGI